MKQKSKCSYSWYHLNEETAVVQLLFASGVRDLQYGILQFQLLVMVWFFNFIFSSASLLCFLWGRELKGAFWQCQFLSPQACSCYCNGSSVYLLVCFTEILVSNGLFADFWFPVSSHPLIAERILIALVQARWEWAAYWLAVMDTCDCPVSVWRAGVLFCFGEGEFCLLSIYFLAHHPAVTWSQLLLVKVMLVGCTTIRASEHPLVLCALLQSGLFWPEAEEYCLSFLMVLSSHQQALNKRK